MPPELEPVLRLGGVLSSVMAGVLGWVYWRRLALDAAQARLNSINEQTIASLESDLRLHLRKIDLALTARSDCEKELLRTKEALAEWETMLGSIWLRDGEPEE